MIYTTLVQGRYPPYRDIIAEDAEGLDGEDPAAGGGVLRRVRQAAIMTDDESKRVDMTFEAGKVTLQARGRGDRLERGRAAAAGLRRPGGEDRLRPGVPDRVPAGAGGRADRDAGDDRRRRQAGAVQLRRRLPVPGDAAGGVRSL